MASVRISQRLASARKRDKTPESPPESQELSEPQKKKRVFISRKYWTQEEEQELLKRYRNGDEFPDIAAHFGASVAAVTQRYSKIKDRPDNSINAPTSTGSTPYGSAQLHAEKPVDAEKSTLTEINRPSQHHAENDSQYVFSPMDLSKGAGLTLAAVLAGNQGQVCKTCQQSGSTDANPLVPCVTCKLYFHKECHHPPIKYIVHYGLQWECEDCNVKPLPYRPPPSIIPDPPMHGTNIHLHSEIRSLAVKHTEAENKIAGLTSANGRLENRMLTAEGKCSTLEDRSAVLETQNLDLNNRCITMAHQQAQHHRVVLQLSDKIVSLSPFSLATEENLTNTTPLNRIDALTVPRLSNAELQQKVNEQAERIKELEAEVGRYKRALVVKDAWEKKW